MIPTSSAGGLRLVFAGTPDFAARHLDALLGSRHHLVGVYSQPDRPAGRGKKLAASPVKALALARDIPVFQPLNFKSPEAVETLRALRPDVMVVVAYGLLLPQAVLEIPRLGCINVHASLLPRWRGAAPIQRAIEAGDSHTGVTIMQMDVGLDTGDMLVKATCPLAPAETAASLHDRLAELGTPALLEALDQLQAGSAQPQKQDDLLACYAAKLTKEEAQLDWRQPAAVLERRVRAFNPFPVAFTLREGASAEERIRVWAADVRDVKPNAVPGTVLSVDSQGVEVACGEGSLRLLSIQLPGKKALPLDELLRGHPQLFESGERLALPGS